MCDILCYLIVDGVAYMFLKEAMVLFDSSVQEFVRQIIKGEIKGLPCIAEFAEGIEPQPFGLLTG